MFSAGLLSPFPGVMLAREIEAGVKRPVETFGLLPSSPTAFAGQAADTGHIKAQGPQNQQEPPPSAAHPWRSGSLLCPLQSPRPFGGDGPRGSLSPVSLTWRWWPPGLCQLCVGPVLSVSQLN